MIQPKELFAAKPFPKWFSNHPIFKTTDKITKVFPAIGLPNSKADTAIDNSKATKSSAMELMYDIMYQLSYAKYSDLKSNSKLKKLTKIQYCTFLQQKVYSLLNKSRSKFIVYNNGRITLNLPKEIIGPDKKPVFRKGEGLFRVYNKICELQKDARIKVSCKLESMEYFKIFSSDNIPNNKFNIVFSSDGTDGLWDIATMSQRGIRSCQSWDGDYNQCLIGSVLDPFVGIIYITSGTKLNDFGSKMLKRSVVRFVINKKTKKPYLVIDQMYPQYDLQTFGAFANFLKEKTHNRFDVVYGPKMGAKIIQNSYTPSSPIINKIKEFDKNKAKDEDDEYYDAHDYYNSIRSYQDTPIPENTASRDKQLELFKKNSNKKENRFLKQLSEALKTSASTVSTSKYPDTLKPAIRRLKGEKSFNYSHILGQLGLKIGKEIIKSIDKNQFTNSDTYLRRIYYNYFNLRTKILSTSKTKFVKDFNSDLNFKKTERLHGNNFVLLMDKLFKESDPIIKEHLKTLAQNRKFSGSLPLP